jgi:Family of unknown function (DUF5343)
MWFGFQRLPVDMALKSDTNPICGIDFVPPPCYLAVMDMNPMEALVREATSRKPPFLSFKTLTNFLDQFQDKSVPSHIDRSILPSSMSGGNQAYLQGALKYLGLISEHNVPSEYFIRLTSAQKEQKGPIWREIVDRAYGFVMNDIDIERATTKIVADRFKEQGISGDTVRKAITFFQHAAKEAGMQISPHLKPAAGPRNRTPRPLKSDSKAKLNVQSNFSHTDTSQNAGNPATVDSPYQLLINILDVGMNDDEQAAVWTIIKYLKKREASDVWSSQN